MATSKQVQLQFEQLLKQLRPIRTRRMFGGVGIWDAELDLFFAIVAGDRLYFKVDDSNRADYLDADMPKFGNMNYYQVPDLVLDKPEQLSAWIERAVTVAACAKKRG